jgi:transposase
MKIVELYLRVRQSVFVEGRSRRETARLFGIARKTVDKMCAFSAPPGYRRRSPPARPKLDGFTNIIDQILSEDQRMPAKQKHTAKRIFERLCDEYGFTGHYTIVKSYIHDRQVSSKEMFVPLHHPAGHAQVDFGEALGRIGGVTRKLHFFCMDLPHSDAIFVKAYPAETTEAFLDGHVAAFAFFGKLPLSILYDNTRLAVAAILGDGRRQRTRAFTELQSHYLFEDRFGRPGKGNDKGKVEGLVGYARRNFMVPMPEVASYEDLNSRLAAQCLERRREVLRGQSQTIDERLAGDLTACRSLPAVPFDPCDQRPGRVSSISLVRYRGNDYSVPTCYGHREVHVKGYVDTVVIIHASEVIARHQRSYERGDFVFDPLHYLALLERKTRALDQAAPLQGWALPAVFAELRRLLEARLEKQGRREFVQVLRLLEVFPLAEVAAAIQDALERGALGFDAIKLLTLCRIERRPAQLDLSGYPYLAKAVVKTTAASDYLALVPGRAA